MLNPPPVPREGRAPNVPLSITSRVAQFAVNCLFNSLGSMPVEYFTFSEGDFHAEVYHQCRQRFSPRTIGCQFPHERAVQHPITLTSESGKTVAAARDIYGVNMEWMVPDLLFHNPVGLDSQWCVAELKRRNRSTDEFTILKDLRNLVFYTSGQLEFRHSVFTLNNIPRDRLTVGGNFQPGNGFTTDDLLNLFENQIAPVEHPEYLEIWVINPSPAAQNPQDPLFVLERTFHNPAMQGRPWQTQNYTRRGNRLSLNR